MLETQSLRAAADPDRGRVASRRQLDRRRGHTCGMPKNIMPAIPGEYLSPSRYWLPSPETAIDATHQVQCTLPRFGAVRITYQRMTHKRGRIRSWFWTPVRAEQTGAQA
jgi:hypothetical protein